MDQQIKTSLGTAIIIIFAITAAVFVVKIHNYQVAQVEKERPWTFQEPTKPTVPQNGGVACTMEAMLCPDGKTAVGRSGPNCEFEKCPEAAQGIVYRNEKYGFELTLPEAWRDYKTEEGSDGTLKWVEFIVADNNNPANSISAFSISYFDKGKWKRQQMNEVLGDYIGENMKYYFVYSPGLQDMPPGTEEIVRILSTFPGSLNFKAF